jgi:hypothetical protein
VRRSRAASWNGRSAGAPPQAPALPVAHEDARASPAEMVAGTRRFGPEAQKIVESMGAAYAATRECNRAVHLDRVIGNVQRHSRHDDAAVMEAIVPGQGRVAVVRPLVPAQSYSAADDARFELRDHRVAEAVR